MDIALSRPVLLWDILAFTVLLTVTRYGLWLKTYGDVPTRQWVCTILGFITASFILDDDVGYFVLSIFTTITLISLSGPRYCHVAAMIGMFGYLSMYRIQYGDKMDIFSNYLIASTTLNLTGVAFEINKAFRTKDKEKSRLLRPAMKQYIEYDPLKLKFIDMVHYTFSYTTIFTGPYVRYQVYADFIQLPYAILYDRPTLKKDATLKKIAYLLMTFFILHTVWPNNYITSTNFSSRNLLYKLIYSGILFFKFRVVFYIYNCVTEQMNKYAGFGMYERHCNCLRVYGPTHYGDNLKDLLSRKFSNIPVDLCLETDTIEVTKPLLCELSSSVYESLPYWNYGLVYWLNEYINKQLLAGIDSRYIRSFLTAAVCLLWHGAHPTLLIVGVLTLYYLHVESIFLEINAETNKIQINPLDIGLWISKQLVFSWCLIPYFLPNLSHILFFYRATYFLPLIFLILMHFVGAHVNISSKRTKDMEELSDSELLMTFKM